ncbi:rhomboid family intramembrane serine protease [Cerasicoccus fimbriatus]|uniref:rhomboid family intramembrane serine protease n=1 Tax=Cerasicoccus fimbriatus TaxID=3014554 RepID=UPI0022B4A51E|nr:rhomboid family intramembrane serine protease [Cerasicoccus sp. TK19100]
MRDRAPIRHVDYFWWSFWIFVGAFLIQNMLGVWLNMAGFLYEWFALSPANVGQGKVWTIFTYSLMHRDLSHFFYNGLIFFLAGRWLSRELAPKRYLHLILGSVFLGGLVWLVLHTVLGSSVVREIPVIGFSAGTSGLLMAMLLIWPREKIEFLLFFVLPVSFRTRSLIYVLLGIEVLGFVFVELALLLGFTPMLRDSSIAFSAHLGGALAGYLFYRMLQRPTPIFESVAKKVSIEPAKWTKKRTRASTGKFKVNLTNRKDLRLEVDRILDKINKEGFQSLNDEEKKVLDDAGDLLKK